MSRKLHISAYSAGTLSALNKINNYPQLTELSGPINLYLLLGGQFIQSGVEKIVTYKSDFIEEKDFNFLSDRIKYYKSKNYFTELEKPFKLFEYYLPDFDKRKLSLKSDKDKKIYNLAVFLGELFFSYKHNTSFPILLKMPAIEEYKEILPIEFYKPLEYLFSCINIDPIKLPTLKTSINKKDILNFSKVVESKQYSEYCKSHFDIDNSHSSLKKSIKNIEFYGRQLYFKNSSILTFNSTLVTTLSTSTKLIDLFAGKLYGTISTYLVELLTNAQKNEHRISMYDCRNTLDEVFMTRVKKLL